MNARTKALAISKEVKETVYKRDRGRCILCGAVGLPEAHYIPRSKGGLGIEQNIVTLCRPCHDKLDNTTERKALLLGKRTPRIMVRRLSRRTTNL